MPLGLRLLLRRPRRLPVALAGIVVAVAIMLVEIAMLSGVLEAEARVATLVRADFVVMSRQRSNLHDWTQMPMIRLAQIAGLAEVERVIPIFESNAMLRSGGEDGRPRNAAERRYHRVVVFSFSPEAVPLAIGDSERVGAELKEPGSALFDRDSRPIYGNIATGSDVELRGRHWQINGLVDIGPDIVNDGAVVMSAGNAGETDWPIMGAVRLKPGTDAETAREHILARLPADVSVLTPAELRTREIGFTLRVVPIGILFAVGMVAGLLIGAMTCYQVLFSEIADHLKMYSTLKAAGFSDAFLRRTIVEQSITLSLLGFAVGLGLGIVLCLYITRSSGFEVLVAPLHGALVCALTIIACIGAGLVAVRQVIVADPAELF
jgi:putative ABC transport system permease protein